MAFKEENGDAEQIPEEIAEQMAITEQIPIIDDNYKKKDKKETESEKDNKEIELLSKDTIGVPEKSKEEIQVHTEEFCCNVELVLKTEFNGEKETTEENTGSIEDLLSDMIATLSLESVDQVEESNWKTRDQIEESFSESRDQVEESNCEWDQVIKCDQIAESFEDLEVLKESNSSLASSKQSVSDEVELSASNTSLNSPAPITPASSTKELSPNPYLSPEFQDGRQFRSRRKLRIQL